MAKSQTNVRLTDDVVGAAKKAAKERGLKLGEYIEQLIVEDTTGARAREMAAAKDFIDKFGADLDAFEEEHLKASAEMHARMAERVPSEAAQHAESQAAA